MLGTSLLGFSLTRLFGGHWVPWVMRGAAELGRVRLRPTVLLTYSKRLQNISAARNGLFQAGSNFWLQVQFKAPTQCVKVVMVSANGALG